MLTNLSWLELTDTDMNSKFLNCFFLFLGQNVTVTAGLEQFMTTFCQGYDIVHMQEYLCIFTNNV